MPPNGNAGLTRSLILKSATSIISQDGLEALTAGRLIELAGISKGGLYHHFRTMTEVESEVLERLLQNFIIRLSVFEESHSVDAFFEHVEQEIFENFLVKDESNCALFAFTSAAATNLQTRVMLNKFMEDLTLLRLKKLKTVAPNISPVVLHSAAQLISTLQLGLTARFFSGVDSVSLKNYWQSLRVLLISAIHQDSANGLYLPEGLDTVIPINF